MKKQKRNNKGFSMVELIIVIAIMAILTAITAPQYLKYVEKSKQAKDETNLDTILTAIKVATLDTDNSLTAGTYHVTINDSNLTVTDTNDDGAGIELKLETLLQQNLGSDYTSNKITAKRYSKVEYTIVIADDGTPTITRTNTVAS